MGKRPLAVLIGLVGISTTLTGCQNCPGCKSSSTYHPSPVFQARNNSSSNTTQQTWPTPLQRNTDSVANAANTTTNTSAMTNRSSTFGGTPPGSAGSTPPAFADGVNGTVRPSTSSFNSPPSQQFNSVGGSGGMSGMGQPTTSGVQQTGFNAAGGTASPASMSVNTQSAPLGGDMTSGAASMSRTPGMMSRTTSSMDEGTPSPITTLPTPPPMRGLGASSNTPSAPSVMNTPASTDPPSLPNPSVPTLNNASPNAMIPAH